MNKRKGLTWLTLIAFLITLLPPLPVFANVSTVNITNANEFNYKAESGKDPKTIAFDISGLTASADVMESITITIGNDSPISFNPNSTPTSNLGDCRIKTNKILVIDNVSSSQVKVNADIMLTDPYKAGERDSIFYITTKASGNSTKSLKMKVEAGPVAINRSTLEIKASAYDDNNKDSRKASGSLTLMDQYGNATMNIPDGQSLYLWSQNKGEITFASGVNGVIQPIPNTKIYELKKSDLSDQQKGKISFLLESNNGIEQIHCALGSSGLTQEGAIQTISDRVSATVNLTLATVTVNGALITGKNPGVIDIYLEGISPVNHQIEVTLPQEFVTSNGTNTVVIDDDDKPLEESIVMKSVPDTSYKVNPKDIQLKVDGKVYEPTQYLIDLKVNPKPLDIKIENELDFRHSSTDPDPSNILFTIGNIDASGTSRKIRVTSNTTGSVFTFTDGGLGEYKVSNDGKVVEFDVRDQDIVTKELKVQVERANAENGGIVLPFTIETLVNGKLEGKAQINLKYKITDNIVDISKSVIGNITPQSHTIDKDGKVVYSTTANVVLKDKDGVVCGEMNGRSLYLWVESTNNKDKFDIVYTGGDQNITIRNSVIAEVEGTVLGENNVFKVIDSRTDDGNLSLDQLPIKISSPITGTFEIKMAMGRNAKEAYNSKDIRTAEFTFVPTEKIPIVSIKNKGIVYDKYPFGTLEYRVENLTLSEDDKAWIILPGDFEGPDGTSEIQITAANKTGESTYSGEIKLTKAPEVEDGSNDSIYEVGFVLKVNEDKLDYANYDQCSVKVTKKQINPSQFDLTMTIGNANKTVQVNQFADVKITAATEIPDELKGKSILFWVEDKNNQIVKEGIEVKTISGQAKKRSVEEGKYSFTIDQLGSSNTLNLQVKLDKEGEYTLKAQLLNGSELLLEKEDQLSVVTEIITPVQWQFAQIKVDGAIISPNSQGNYIVSQEKIINKNIEIIAIVKDSNNNVLSGKNVQLTGLPESKQAQTDSNGQVKFTISLDQAKTYTLNAIAKEGTEDKVNKTIQIKVVKESEVTKDFYRLKLVHQDNVVAVDSRTSAYLEVYDQDDDLVKITSNSMAEDVISSIYFSDKPSKSDLRDRDIRVTAQDNGIEISFYPDYRGDYEIVAIAKGNSDKKVYIDVTAKDQGKVVEMELEYSSKYLEIGEESSRPRLITYDKDGIKAEKSVTSSDIKIVATGSALANIDRYGVVTAKDNERYIGNIIEVTAVYEDLGLVAYYQFEVTDDGYGDDSSGSGTSGNGDIHCWDTYATIGKYEKLRFTVNDKEGFQQYLPSGAMSSFNKAEAKVTIVSKPSGATVRASIVNNGRDLEQGGYGYLEVYSNKEGIVKLDVSIKAYNSENSTTNYKRYDYYKGRVEIDFGKSTSNNGQFDSNGSTSNNNPNSGDSVAMLIGSTKYMVGQETRYMDVAPFLKDNRTYVPIRALGDSLGATTNYDNAQQKITISYRGKSVTMTIGSKMITTSDNKTIYSDVAPFTKDGRTVLPLRAAAESLGCQVSPVYDGNNRTIGAIFSK